MEVSPVTIKKKTYVLNVDHIRTHFFTFAFSTNSTSACVERLPTSTLILISSLEVAMEKFDMLFQFILCFSRWTFLVNAAGCECVLNATTLECANLHIDNSDCELSERIDSLNVTSLSFSNSLLNQGYIF